MLTLAKKYFAPPVFAGDEDKTRAAVQLTMIVYVLLLCAAAYMLALPVLVPPLANHMWLAAPIFPLLIGILAAIRRGWLRLASAVLVMGLWLVLLYSAAASGGMDSPAYAGFIVMVLCAGILLGQRYAVWVAALSIAAGLVMVELEQAGLLPARPAANTPVTIWLAQAVYFVLAVALLYLATFRIGSALARARRELAERTRVEEALRESEERLQRMAEATFEGIVISEQGRIIEANAQIARILGYELAELVGKSVMEFVAPESRQMVSEQVRSGSSISYQHMALRKDGALLPVEVQAREMPYHGRQVWVTAIRDIAAHVKAERVQTALYRISEAAHTTQALDELYHSIHLIIGELMPATNFYIALYDAAADLLSMQYFVDQVDAPPPPSRLGKGLTAYVLRTGQPLLASSAAIEQFVQSGQVELVGTLPVNWLGVPLKTHQASFGVMALQTYSQAARLTESDKDVLVFVSTQVAMAIQRKQADEALRKNQALLQTIVENLPFEFWACGPDERYVMQNAADINLWGDLIGKTVEEIGLPEDELAAWRVNHDRAFAGEFVRGEVERTIGGHKRNYFSIIGPIRDGDMVSGILGIRIDITERKQAEAAVRQERDRAQQYLDIAEVILVAINADEEITLINQKGGRVLGYKEDQLVGKNWFDICLPAPVRSDVRSGFAQLIAGDIKPVEYYENPVLTQAGEERIIAWHNTVLRDDRGNIIGTLSSGEDITERKLADEQIRKLNRMLRVINEVNQVLVRTDEEPELLRQVCQIAVNVGAYRMAWVGLAEQDKARSVRPVASAGHGADYLDAIHITWADDESGRGPTGTAIRTGQPVAAHNILTDPDYALWRERAVQRGYAASIALPLAAEGRVFGALSIYAGEPDAFDAEEVSLLVEMANDLAYGLVALRTRAALRESQERTRAIVDSAPFGAHLYELRPDGQLVFVGANRSADQILGVDNQQFVGKTIEQAFPPLAQSEIPESYRRAAATGERYQIDQVDYDDAGIRGAFEVHAFQIGPNRMAAFFRDITERKRAEEEIKRLNQSLERRARELSALNQAGQIMASTLDLGRLLERVIQQVRGLLDVQGASVLLCAEPESGDSAGAACSELVFAAVTGPAAQELTGQRVPGTAGIANWVVREKQSVLIADAQADPRFYDSIDMHSGLVTHSILAVPLISKGSVLGVVEAVNKAECLFDQHDLQVLEALCNSAAISIENARHYAREKLRAAELARALERQRELDRLQREFIQNVSHELRTPLALIRGHAEVLESGWMGELMAEQKESVAVIARRSQVLTQMVNDIISVLEVEQRSIVRAPVDLAQLARAALFDLRASAEEADLVLSADMAPGVPPILGDAIALRRALDNLLSNALKFTPAGGRVTVHLAQQAEAQAVSLQVADTGIGIASEHLERIFERFYQVDGSTTRKYGGMGLGLSLVKTIVEAHGGQITVASQVGAGTTFTVTFPQIG